MIREYGGRGWCRQELASRQCPGAAATKFGYEDPLWTDRKPEKNEPGNLQKIKGVKLK